MNQQTLKNILEGFLFASDKVLSLDQIIKLFPEGESPAKDEVSAALESLMEDFKDHGIELKKVSSGFRFQVRESITPWVSRLWEEKPSRYTRALLETLSIIVYRQPITRSEIEEIRGVAVSSNIVKTLQERDWVKVIGHKDVPGRPALLATTKQFLDYFNLESLEDLPPLSEIKDLEAIATELDPEQNAALLEAIREIQQESAENEDTSQESEDEKETDSNSSDSEVVVDSNEDSKQEPTEAAEIESTSKVNEEEQETLIAEDSPEEVASGELVEEEISSQMESNPVQESLEESDISFENASALFEDNDTENQPSAAVESIDADNLDNASEQTKEESSCDDEDNSDHISIKSSTESS